MGMTLQQKLISELTQLNEREGGPAAHHRLGHYLTAAVNFEYMVRRGTDPSVAFTEIFVPTRGMHRIARRLGLHLTVERGQWIRTNPSMHVASLLFDKRVFTPRQAAAWAHAHGFKSGHLEAPPTGQYLHIPQHPTGRVKRIIALGGTRSGIRAIVARNPQPVCQRCGLRHPPYTCREGVRRNAPRYQYVYRPGVLDRFDPTTIKGHAIAPGTLVRVLAKRPAGGKSIAGWGRTFAFIQDIHGNEQIVFRRALQKTSAHGY